MSAVRMHQPDYYGNLVRQRVAGAFAITESVIDAGSMLPVHSHGCAYFTFTLKGSYREEYGGRMRECTPGTAVAHPARETHSQEFGSEPALLLRLGVLEPFEDVRTRVAIDRPASITSPMVMRAAWQLHSEIQAADAYADLILEGLAYELTGYAMRSVTSAGGSSRRALRAEALLRASLRTNQHASSLAKQLGVSTATFFRDFRSFFGCTPGEYQRRLRISAAMEALRCSGRPLADIAAECGFYDQSHLNRSFRRLVGVSPAEFRLGAQ